MTTTRTLQSGGWTWAGSSRMLWSRWGSLGSFHRGVLCNLWMAGQDWNPHLSHMSGHRLCLISPYFITSWLKVNSFHKSNLCLASCFPLFFDLSETQIVAKNKPGSSVFSEHVCFVICYLHHSFMTTSGCEAERWGKKKNKRNTFRWKSDMIAQNMHTDSLQKLCRGAGKTTAALEEICEKNKSY